MLSSRRDSDKQEVSPVSRDLLAICATLNIAEPRGPEAVEVFSHVKDKVGLFNVIQITVCQGCCGDS